MHQITLKQFIETSGLSDKSILYLLAQNLLPCEYQPDTGLTIDIDNVEYQKLIQDISVGMEEYIKNKESIFTEKLATIIKTNFGHIIETALKKKQNCSLES